MKTTLPAIGAGSPIFLTAFQLIGSEPEWGPSRVKDCNRECVVGIMDGYLNAIYKHGCTEGSGR
jgi:hypothetical protein